ncbi:MAG: hypothetical protein EOP24_39135 [Hyphomicrobiales bacterium]|nr:MAG: hypothetical protein EOP24_39135 [Hyphomicrobiales bacterium]
MVVDALWEMVEPLIPHFSSRPQGGGTAQPMIGRCSPRSCTCSPVGCAWRKMPPSFGVTVPTSHRRVQCLDAGRVVREASSKVLDWLRGAGDSTGWR